MVARIAPANDNGPKERIGMLSAFVAIGIAIVVDLIQASLTLFYGLAVIATTTTAAGAAATVGSALTVIGIPFAILAGTFTAASGALAVTSAGIAFLGPWIITLFAAIGFWLYFHLAGVRFLSGKRLFPRISGALLSLSAESIPFFNIFFGVTSGVMSVILTTRKEDRLAREEYAASLTPPPKEARQQSAANDNNPKSRQEIPNQARMVA